MIQPILDWNSRSTAAGHAHVHSFVPFTLSAQGRSNLRRWTFEIIIV
jgi:hypothetical protein